jgi:hypothetical protein
MYCLLNFQISGVDKWSWIWRWLGKFDWLYRFDICAGGQYLNGGKYGSRDHQVNQNLILGTRMNPDVKLQLVYDSGRSCPNNFWMAQYVFASNEVNLRLVSRYIIVKKYFLLVTKYDFC